MAKKNQNHRGFSLVELIVAIAVFGIIVGGMVTLITGTYMSSFENEERLQANAVLTETWEALRAIRNNDWNNIIDGNWGLRNTNGYWELYGSSDEYSGIIRQVSISNAQRDPSGQIVPSGGEVDPDTMSIQVQISWNPTSGNTQTISFTNYLNNYPNPGPWPPAPPPKK